MPLTANSDTRDFGIYCRISQDRGRLGFGVDRQEADGRAAAERLGYPPERIRVYRDNDISARSGRRRPGHERLMTDVDRGALGGFWAYSMSRLWKKGRQRADGIERCKDARMHLIFGHGMELDMTTPVGRYIADMAGAQATMEGDEMSERLRREVIQRAERGQPYGGHRPYGYSPDRRSLVPAEADRLRAWYADLIAGRSVASIAREAGRSRASLRKTLVNPRNAGLRVLRGVEYPGAWPAIVDGDTWRAACSVLADPDRRANDGRTARRWVGSGLYRCERCGGRPVRSDYRGKLADGSTYRVYRCHWGDKGCRRQWKAGPVDAFVLAAVAARLSAPDLAETLPQSMPDLAPLRAERAATRHRLDVELPKMWARGALSDAGMEAAAAELAGRLAELGAALEGDDGRDPLAPLLEYDDPGAAFLALPADDAQRVAAVIRRLCTVTLGTPPRGRFPRPVGEYVDLSWR